MGLELGNAFQDCRGPRGRGLSRLSDVRDVHRNAEWTGVLLLVGAALLWSLNGALIKLLVQGDHGPHGVTIAFYRSLFAGLFLLPLAWGRFQTLIRPATPESNPLNQAPSALARPGLSLLAVFPSLFSLRPAALICVFLFTLMTACFVMANTLTESANAIILQYTSTFWIFLLSPWLLKEKPDRGDLWLLGVAMLGIAVIFGGQASTHLPGLVIALLSGLFFGLLTVCIRQMRDSNPAAVTVMNNLGSAVLLLPAVLWLDTLMLDRRTFYLLLFMGVVQFGVPYYFYTLGLARIPAYRAALITLLELVLNPLWALLAVGEKPPVTTLIGGALVLAALVVILRGSAHTRSNERR